MIPDSPFTVQKLGEILDVKTGEEYSNIQSDSLALARAEYENWKNCRLTDAITIKTVIVPFADVNVKCAYQRSDMEYPQQYIMKSVSHNFSEGTTTWSMYRFIHCIKILWMPLEPIKPYRNINMVYLANIPMTN